jgi:hypothetical protein
MIHGSIQKLFICMKVTTELDRMFQENMTLYITHIQQGGPDSLKVSEIDGTKFLGQVVDQGLPENDLLEISRRVRHVVGKFCPHMRTSDDMVKIFIQEYIG